MKKLQSSVDAETLLYYYLEPILRRSGRVVECGCLENSCAFAGTVGSNPTSSAKILPNNFRKIYFRRFIKKCDKYLFTTIS